MEKPKLKYWKYLDDLMRENRITLSDSQNYASLSCKLYKNGHMELSTSCGEGHGEPEIKDKGRLYSEWQNLLQEAKQVQEYYFG